LGSFLPEKHKEENFFQRLREVKIDHFKIAPERCPQPLKIVLTFLNIRRKGLKIADIPNKWQMRRGQAMGGPAPPLFVICRRRCSTFAL
jgi:hypothetical protein